MTALKCILWRRPRNTRRRQSRIMSLVQTTHNNHRKCSIKFKQCLKRCCSARKYQVRTKLGSEREMPCLEPTSGSEVVPCSPEMPTLLPFTTEHEDPTSGVYQITCSTSPEKDGHQFVRVLRGGKKETYQPVVVLKRLPPQQEDGVPGMPFELEELRRRGDGSLASPPGARIEDDWLQWPEEYEGCSCEDLVDVSPVGTGNSLPEIDVIEGVEFFSFLQEEDMNNYSRLHSRSWFFDDSFTSREESPTLSMEDFVEEKTGGLIFPTKTKDITQIKGWKRKLFAEGCKDFESASWIHRKEEETTLVIPEEKRPSCSAFTSTSLEDFLKTSSELHISYLASYIPNVTPIPSDSPILSVGTLTKDSIPTRELTFRTESIGQKALDVSTEREDLPFATEQNNTSAVESKEDSAKSILDYSPLLLKETVSPDRDDPILVEDVDVQSKPNSPRMESSCDDILLDETNSVIREPILDGEEDRQRLSEFLSELRQANVYNVFHSRYEQATKTNMYFPTITEKVAHAACSALSRIADDARRIEKIPDCSLDKVTSPTSCSLEAVEKSPERRNKRMIRLPARFLDSAVIFPGSEGWIAPEHPNSRKRRRRSEVASRADRLQSRSKNGESKTEYDGKDDTCQTPPEFSKGIPDSQDLVQLRHLKDHDLVGASVVRSLLIVHSSLRLQETVAKNVSLPLAGIALPIDSSQKFDGRDPLVYLLYGLKDALLQNHWSASESSSLENLLQGDSPVVPVLHNISSGILLEKNPVCTKAVLESRVLTLLVYLSSSGNIEEQKRKSSPSVVANGVVPSSTTKVTLFEKSNGDCCNVEELGEISSLQVSRNKITVKSTSDAIVLLNQNISPEIENGLHPEGEGDSDVLVRAKRAEAMVASRKDLRHQMHYLYDTLLSTQGNENDERLSGVGILEKATAHIFSLRKRAKELKKKKRRLRAVHDKLVESYSSCLEILPARAQKKALDTLSRQIAVPARKSNCLQQEKKRIADAEVQKVAQAAWSLVGPCSVQRVELRNGHTVYVYSSHAKDEEEKVPVKEKDAIVVEDDGTTSLWVSDVGEPCFVTRLLPEEDDENR